MVTVAQCIFPACVFWLNGLCVDGFDVDDVMMLWLGASGCGDG